MESHYPLDHLLGMGQYITSSRGIKGKLRVKIEDFEVNERFEKAPEEPEGEYTHMILEKFNWDTMRAMKAVTQALKVSHKRVGYAGTKDKRALTRQRIALWKVSHEALEKLAVKDIKVYDFMNSSQRISLGDALGNDFVITLRELEEDRDKIIKSLDDTKFQLEEKGVPNFFGYQRFGTMRPNTHLVGRELIRGDLEGAVWQYLGKPSEAEREDAFNARKNFQDTGDIKKALEEFPKRLNYERNMLDALQKNPNDYAGALRRFPKKLRRMFIHAYQSYFFNKILSKMIEEGMDIRDRNIPLFGYESEFSGGRQGEIEKEIIEEEGLDLSSFKLKNLPELKSPGKTRPAAIEAGTDFSLMEDEDSTERLKAQVKFFLPPGCYATVVLREYMKTDPLDY